MRRMLWGLAAAASFAALLGVSGASAADYPTPGVPDFFAPPEAGSTLLECSGATTRHTLTVDTHLDPGCVWTRGFDIVASDVALDCQGALIQRTGGPRGIEISSTTDTAMSGVTVQNCRVDGFLNNLRITRPGFRDLEEGVEYENGLTGVVIENNEFRNSHGVGVFVDGYVSDATIRNNIIEGTGSTGIYLETGSRRTRVEGNQIHNNGFRENGPGGEIIEFAGSRFRWWGIGREGLAIDGSYENVVVGNSFEGNSHGGILLYTNCGEFPESGRWFDRRWPSDRNHIDGNSFTGGLNGIWVGQRMAENTLPMECTKPAYVETPFSRITRDFAADNTLTGNTFVDVTYPIRIEDDGTTVTDNIISSSNPEHHGIIIGTEFRTTVLDEPIARTSITGNTIDIVDNASPIRWVHGFADLTVENNTSQGAPVGICEGVQPPRLALIWVLAAVPEPLGAPETPAPADLSHPVLGPLPSCERPGEPRVVPGFAEIIEATDATVRIPVALSHPTDETVRVQWETPTLDHPALARAEVDFIGGVGELAFEPGQTLSHIEMALLDDDVAEPLELLGVRFHSPTNAQIGGWWGIGLGFIADND